ncbi:uncharacterized protein ELE39_003665 [Cryptosporidium sp. chipmunk genotype I]|uniref:uncharacterized protein n=1 Tax=Cryptosporidium sp. chipmunk genotype I TaxID=1280935 RepID=UPI00351A6117|nr:hypothetical protein ELE39_003665 [Cryptosporidium sp. chipmunk genotype I]
MVLVGDFNKEVIGLFKSKYPTEKDKLLELNLSSICKNPSFSYNISSSLNGEKNGNKVKCCDEGNGSCGENNNNISNSKQIFTLEGNSTLKCNIYSTQMETKMDMNGISIMEVKTRPYYGVSLISKYERFPKVSGSSNIDSGSGCLEIGGDIQSGYIQSRFRISPSIGTLGCVNKLNKENKDSIGMMLSNTVTLRPFSCVNSLSLGAMISSSNVNLHYISSNNNNRNSMKIMMGLMLKGPLFMGSCKNVFEDSSKGFGQLNHQGLIHKKESLGSRFKSNITFNNDNNDLNSRIKESSSLTSASIPTPNYVLSLQTNTNNHNNKLSGFTGGLILNNLIRNYLTLGLMVSYNTGNSNGGVNLIGGDNNQQIEDNGLTLMSKNKGSKAYYENCLSKFSEKVQYTIGGKISFGSMDSNNNTNSDICSLFDKKLSLENGTNVGDSDNISNVKSTDLRFKIMNNLKMAYSLTHNFTRNISATFGAQIDPRKLNNPDSIKYGFILDMSA